MKKLWGGRFKKEMHPTLKCFSYSLAVDHELLEAEILVDQAWVKMLAKIGVLKAGEAKKLLAGLHSVAKELAVNGPHDIPAKKYVREFEDIHTLIQTLLEKKVGPAAKKIHTGRSRNDLVVTSTRVYLRTKIVEIDERIAKVQKALVVLAKKAGHAIVPGLTHLKFAQPILVAHHLLAYVEMLAEDRERLADTQKRVNVLGLGSAALAGSGIAVDQAFLAKELGFSKISANSLTAVSDRAFITEFLAGLSNLWIHLSRLAEDFILWNSEPFRYIELDDAFATGSSLMPQKKNPDVFELLRGRSAVIFGHLQAILVLQKGLPLAYNRDLQEDKPALFDSVHKTKIALNVLAPTLESTTFHFKTMAKACQDDNLFATDILDYLVRKGVSFSEAHHVVGQAVQSAIVAGKALKELTLTEWKGLSKSFDGGVFDLFDVKDSVAAKKTIGSTHPARVKKEIEKWEKILHA